MDETLVAGVDGCRAGWLYVVAAIAGECLSLRTMSIVPTLGDVLSETKACATVSLDMPVGLPDAGPRLADREARRLLGGRRGSSVFPAPVRAALDCDDYRAACDASFAACGKMLSKQTFMILPKIREVDVAMTPALQARVFEVHPEVSFRALNADITPPASKHTHEGLAHRVALLAAVYNEDLSLRPITRSSLRDDLLDACVCAWTAARIAFGVASRVPSETMLDAHGLRMEIVY